MYRAVIIYAPVEPVIERLVRRLADCFDGDRFEVAACSADQAAIPDLTAADVFLLASLPSGGQSIHPDFAEIRRRMAQPVVFDGCNLFDPHQMSEAGFAYYSIGRRPVLPRGRG